MAKTTNNPKTATTWTVTLRAGRRAAQAQATPNVAIIKTSGKTTAAVDGRGCLTIYDDHLLVAAFASGTWQHADRQEEPQPQS